MGDLESENADDRFSGRILSSKRSNGIQEERGLGSNKRPSPVRYDDVIFPSPSWPSSHPDSPTSWVCASCGCKCEPYNSAEVLDFMDADLSLASDLTSSQVLGASPQNSGVVGTKGPASKPSTPLRDRLGSNDFGGRMSADVWICGRDAASLELQCGLTWLDIIEPCLDDIYGEEWENRTHPADLERCKAVLSKAKAKESSFQVEYRLKVAEHEYRWVMDFGRPRFSRPKRVFLGYVGWRIDIHQQKSTEVDMEEYWSLPHEILTKASPDGKYFEDVSPAFTKILGYTQREFLNTPWTDLVHPDDREKTVTEFEKVSLGQPIVNLQNRYRCKPGSKIEGPLFVDTTGAYKWFSWTANYMYGAGRDISFEKVAQEDLRKSQAELRRITDAIPGGVFQYKIDENGVETFPFVSKGALSICGSQEHPKDESETAHYQFSSCYPPKESGLSVHADDLPTLREALRQSSLAHTNLDCDYRIVKNGEVRWVRVHAAPQKRGDDGTKEWCGITWDITERHLAEEALRQARDLAEKSSEAKGKFLANMSHEIRTPMNAVIGMGALLLETELNEEQRDYVSTIRSSGEALLSVINDILDFSKVEAGKMDLEVAPFNLTDCIEDSLDLFSSQAASKGLELSYTVAEKVPAMLIGDVSRVRQILVNLLSNALKFTEHGHVSVAVDGRTSQEIPSLRCFDEGRSWLGSLDLVSTEKTQGANWEICISVNDSGIGIPDDRTHTLFQAFRQVDPSTTRKYGGTGLGLAICSHLCALWGGRIWVESIPGIGSTFHFTINAEEFIGENNLHDDDDFLTFLRKKRVLVVAGSSSSSQIICSRFLKSWQVRVVSAITGDETLQVLRQTMDSFKDAHSHSYKHAGTTSLNDPFMAVIVDCTMIDQDRESVMEALQLCRTSPQQIPIVLLTPFARRIQDYVQKEATSSSGFKRWTRQRPSAGTPLSMDMDTGKRFPLRILVAEDNTINQKVILRLLQKYGYTADVVGNGLEAVDAASRQSYDVCLMDCFMPEMDGLEATRRIRQRLHPCPVVVAVTAAALEAEKRACLQAGMHMYIAKPIKADILICTLFKCWQVKTRQITLESLQQ